MDTEQRAPSAPNTYTPGGISLRDAARELSSQSEPETPPDKVTVESLDLPQKETETETDVSPSTAAKALTKRRQELAAERKRPIKGPSTVTPCTGERYWAWPVRRGWPHLLERTSQKLRVGMRLDGEIQTDQFRAVFDVGNCPNSNGSLISYQRQLLAKIIANQRILSRLRLQ